MFSPIPSSSLATRRVPSSAPRSFERGFSLTELLIVIAVIATLLILAISGVGRVRESAEGTVCIENLRQIGVGIQLYAADHKGVYPPCNVGGTPTTKDYWPYLIAPYLGYTKDEGIGVDVLKCRAAKRETGTVFTYGANYPVMFSLEVGQSGVWWLDRGLRRVTNPPNGFPFLIADATSAPIYSPTAWGLTVDRDGDGVNDSNGAFEYNRVKFRHGGRANFLMLDGSIANLKPIDWAQNKGNLWGAP